MKNIKKTLSMVLVIAMMLGILVIGAGAAFTDEEDITYTTAVEVMTGIGAINGYTDGTFKPLDSITRAEAAKMVAYAILTPTVAQMLPKTTSSFSDVAATNWASPFIEYCVSKGIINGMGDGKFEPAGNVTGYQIGKMMLCAAGYGKQDEYVGANWELNAAIDAMDKGIFAGSLDADLSDAATREEAALYVFNALTSSKMQQVVFNSTTNAYELSTVKKTIGDQKYGLARATVNENGVSGYVWKNMFNTVLCSVVYTDNVLGTSTNGTAITDLATSYKPFYIAKLDATVDYYYNGKDYTQYSGDEAAQKAAVKTAVETAAAKKGVIVNFIDTDYNGYADKITVIEKTVFTLIANPVVNAVTGAVTIAGVNGGTAIAAESIDYPADLANGDVILYYQDSIGVFHIEKAEMITGKMTASNKNAGTIVFGGTAYRQSGLVTNVLFNSGTGFGEIAKNFNADATAYLDDNGDIVVISADAAVIQYTYGLVVGYEYLAGTSLTPASAKVRLYTADGKVALYDVAPTAGVVPDQRTPFTGYGKLVAYTINETTGKVTLDPTVVSKTLGADYKAKSAIVAIDSANYYITSNTEVIYFDTTKAYAADNTATILTGSASTIDAAHSLGVEYVTVGATNYLAAILFTQNGSSATVATNYGYVTSIYPSTRYVGLTPYYDYTVYVNGVLQDNPYLYSNEGNRFAAAGLYSYTVDATGMITGATPVTAVTDGTVSLVEPGYVYYLDGTTNTATAINAATAYYLVDAVFGTVTKVDSISATNKITFIQPGFGAAAAIYYTTA